MEKAMLYPKPSSSNILAKAPSPSRTDLLVLQVLMMAGNNASLIIALTTGPLTPKACQETKSKLNDIVERKDQMCGVNNGFKSLEDIINLLVVNSCLEVMAGESYFVCVG
ncbi:hypothetical protein GH733_000946, partial [Mirounga leonina]